MKYANHYLAATLLLTVGALVACGEEIDSNLLVIEFNDSALEQCIREKMGIMEGGILRQDAQTLSSLECTDLGIQDISGLEHFTNLLDLALFENQIVDLSPLSTLTSLIGLQLGSNQINSVSALANLQSLRRLGLFGNNLVSIAPLENLAELEWLTINANKILSVAILTKLPNLKWVALENNPLSETRTLNTLRNQGAEVYDGTEVPTSKSSTTTWESSSPAIASAVNRSLSIKLKKENEVQFQCVLDGQIRKAHHDFGGNIWLVDGRFEYHLNNSKRIIGEGNPESWSICSDSYEAECHLSLGVKYPHSRDLLPGTEANAQPICTVALVQAPKNNLFSAPNSYPTPYKDTELMQYVFAAPNQLDGGTCLFMANTGAMEILMNQHRPKEEWTYEGSSDLSERFLINSSNYVPNDVLDYTITDAIYTYNYHQGSLLNSYYPFTVGDSGDGLSCQVNWDDALPADWKDNLVETPPADRTVLFIDPNLTSQSIWNVGLIGDDVIERIKYELRSKNAPVIVIYNHYLYWHASIVVGYDDRATIGECPMVKESIAYFKQEGRTAAAEKMEEHMENEGGCLSKGIFYVRDSIYDGGAEEIIYNYGGMYSTKYSKRIVERTYDWVKYLGNHSYTIHRK